jgi:adenosine kinase
MEGVLLGICNPLLDISAEVPVEFLTKYDLKPSNAILAEKQHLPLYDEIIVNDKVTFVAGGAGQNAIRAAQWLLQVPKATVYIGCVGKDKNGERLKEEAHHDGVTTHYLVDEENPTGTCACLITQKERSLVANLAAALHYKKSHFDSPEIQALVERAKFFYGSGFFLTVSPETIIAIGEHATKHNKTFLLNLSAPFIIEVFGDKLSSVLPYADFVFGNEHEFASLGKKQGWGDNLTEVAKKLSELPKTNTKRSRVVIVTQGAFNTILVHDGKTEEIPVPAVPAEEIVDTNGAGDSFVGGFLAFLVQGKSLTECVAAGNYVAGLTIRSEGTTFRGKTPSFP